MAISLPDAKKIVSDAAHGAGDRGPGWDGRLTAAILVVMGDGSAKAGRDRLTALALQHIATQQSKSK